MAGRKEKSYIDYKGRLRWHRNDELAEKVKQLGDFLIIGGYEESHASRYAKLAHTISRHPESIARLQEEGRLGEIPGIGGTIASIIGELLNTGTCSKMEEWAEQVPKTVLELTAIPGLGAKNIRTLYKEHGIAGIDALATALDTGELDGVRGIGKKTIDAMRRFIATRKRSSKHGPE
jgi:DNA polymerase (family 10)